MSWMRIPVEDRPLRPVASRVHSCDGIAAAKAWRRRCGAWPRRAGRTDSASERVARRGGKGADFAAPGSASENGVNAHRAGNGMGNVVPWAGHWRPFHRLRNFNLARVSRSTLLVTRWPGNPRAGPSSGQEEFRCV